MYTLSTLYDASHVQKLTRAPMFVCKYVHKQWDSGGTLAALSRHSWGTLLELFGSLGVLFESCWVLFEHSWYLVGKLWDSMGALGRCWEHSLGAFGSLGACKSAKQIIQSRCRRVLLKCSWALLGRLLRRCWGALGALLESFCMVLELCGALVEMLGSSWVFLGLLALLAPLLGCSWGLKHII